MAKAVEFDWPASHPFFFKTSSTHMKRGVDQTTTASFARAFMVLLYDHCRDGSLLLTER